MNLSLLLAFGALMLLEVSCLFFAQGRSTNETDMKALLEFKSQVAENKREVLASWNNSSPLCNWIGVTCGHKQERVISLDVGGFKLAGAISPSIGNLSFLRSLNLADNSFGSTIPQEVGMLFRLQYLNMSFNLLQGRVPRSLSNCSRLSTLDLMSNGLEHSVPSELGSLSKLSILYLNSNNLTGKFPASFGNLTSLLKLDFVYNHIEGEIPEDVARLTQMVFFQISQNSFSGVFPPALHNISSLESLSLAGNSFSGELRADFGDHLPNLRTLLLGSNHFTGAIPRTLANMTTLGRFDISSNNLTGSIPLSFGNLPNLWWLGIGVNSLGTNSFRDLEFIGALTNCTQLEFLDAGHNRLRGELPASTANLSTKLTSLTLGENLISGTIPHDIGNLISLQALSLETNMLTGELPVSFGKLLELRVVDLNSNTISGELPSYFDNMTQLQKIHLNSNSFQGRIPQSLGRCRNLLDLWIDANRLNGTIPQEIVQIPSLAYLDLSNNLLTGPFPEEVGKLELLVGLGASNNKLSGHIPQALGDCLAVEFLYLQGNSFDGAIPDISRLVSLRNVDFSNNNLSEPTVPISPISRSSTSPSGRKTMSQSIQFSTPSRTPHLLHLPQSQFHRPISSFSFRQFPLTSTVKYTSIRASSSPSPSPDLDSNSSQVLLSPNGTGAVKAEERSVVAAAVSTDTAGIDVDTVTEAELKENGFRSTRRTKLICTIGPATCGFEQLEALAEGGMNVARLNMCHGTRDWHRGVIRSVRRLNEEKGFAVAIMMDTEGSEIHMGDFGGESSAKSEDGEIWTFTVRAFDSSRPERTISVSYDGFAEDVRVGDELLVDGGMVRFEVIEKIGPDVKCLCTDPGLLLPRANLTFWRDGSLVRERNAMLPTISSKDWLDIDFGIAEGVDFIAVSFVKSAEVINHLKSYLAARSCGGDIGVIAKIESIDSLTNLEEIIRASDGAMVARGDLGAQIPLEQVPAAQQRIVQVCRALNKPVIVASQLLESMIEYPTPTRAEVADVSEAVRQRSDALMLSGESAMGQFPDKALTVLRSVSLRIERWWREEKRYESTPLQAIGSTFSDKISEEICNSASKMANNLGVDAVFVYTKSGHMASLVSRCRPDCPIFAFTNTTSVRRRLNLQWGLIPFRLSFSDDMESNLNKTFSLLKARGMIKSGDLVIAVSDMLQSIQVMNVP